MPCLLSACGLGGIADAMANIWGSETLLAATIDDPGAIHHLESLLDIDELDGYQWVPGAGASQDPMDWIDLFARIQNRDKKLFISCPPERVSSLLNAIPHRGVYLSIYCDTEAIARETLVTLERLGF